MKEACHVKEDLVASEFSGKKPVFEKLVPVTECDSCILLNRILVRSMRILMMPFFLIPCNEVCQQWKNLHNLVN